jgi:hypothetical protein
MYTYNEPSGGSSLDCCKLSRKLNLINVRAELSNRIGIARDLSTTYEMHSCNRRCAYLVGLSIIGVILVGMLSLIDENY